MRSKTQKKSHILGPFCCVFAVSGYSILVTNPFETHLRSSDFICSFLEVDTQLYGVDEYLSIGEGPPKK